MSDNKKNIKDPMPEEASSALSEEMTDEELEGIAAAGIIRGTHEGEMITGTDGNDRIYAYGGADAIDAGEGDDYIDGGSRDGANDLAFGGAGNDKFAWGPGRDGSDTFHGGDGTDSVEIYLRGTGHSSIQSAFESGYLTLSIDGHPDYVPTYDDNGDMVLPEGASGTITDPTGETMDFTGLEKIGTWTHSDKYI